MLFKELNIGEKVVDDIVSVIYKSNINITKNVNCTINGYQTDNICNIFSNEFKKQILPYENFSDLIFHMHYIEYDDGGYQAKHDHRDTEKFSFILYLNDADGNTVFEEPINQNVKPEKGKLILFDSSILHYGTESFTRKKVLVGAISKIIRKY